MIGPAGLDQTSHDRAYIAVHNYTLAQLAFPHGRVIERALHGKARSIAEWTTQLRAELAALDPDRSFEIAGPVGAGVALDTYGEGRGWRTVYLEKSGFALGVTLVQGGSWFRPGAAPDVDLSRALEQVVSTIEVIPAVAPELGWPALPHLALAARRKRNKGGVGAEASSHKRKTNFWEERVGSNGFVSVERSVDWSRSGDNMKRNRTICKTSADRSFAFELVRNIVTQDSGTCAPRALWSQQINKEFWRDSPADHVWTGSWTSRRVDSRTIFFTFLLQPGIWYCLDHWRPFS